MRYLGIMLVCSIRLCASNYEERRTRVLLKQWENIHAQARNGLVVERNSRDKQQRAQDNRRNLQKIQDYERSRRKR